MALPQEKYYTYEDILNWPGDEQVELINGDVYMMAPAPSPDHQSISWALIVQLGNYLKGKKCRAFHAPFDVRLFEEDGDQPYHVDTVVQPDLLVVCDPSKLDGHGCKGAPDLVIEILSPSTRQHDRLTKLNLYQRAGVQEYWIVDPEEKTVIVMTLEDGEHYAPTAYSSQATVSVGVLEDCKIDLGPVFEGI